MGHLSVWVLCEGNLGGGGSLSGDPQDYVEEGSSDGRGPTGEPGRGLIYWEL
jgi:hypothetical protein